MWIHVERPSKTHWTRADKGWAVKRARSSKKVWCSGLGLCLEISLVFDFGQGLRCGLSIRHCRCHWIMGAWFVFLHFFLVPFCWYAVSERQMLLFFAGGLIGVDKHLFQRVSFITSMTLPLNYIFVLLLANVDVIPKLSKTQRKISSMSSMAILKDSRSCFITRWRVFYKSVQLVQGQIMLISITIILLFNFEKNISYVFLFLRNFKISFPSVFTVYLVLF